MTQTLNLATNKAINTANSLVVCYYQTTAPSTNVKCKDATTRLLSGVTPNAFVKEAARLYATTVAAKGTPVGRAVSIQNATGEKIRNRALICPAGGYYVQTKDVAEVQGIFDDAERDLEVCKQDIIATYDTNKQIVLDQLTKIDVKGGKLADEIILPSATEVASRFTIRLIWSQGPAPINHSILKQISKETANRVAADSQKAADILLRQAHGGPVKDLVNQLKEFCDKLRNAQRLHTSQFDKLADELKRCRELNILNIPEIDAVIAAAAPAAQAKDDNLDQSQRVTIAQTGEDAIQKANDALKALGLA